MSEEKEIRKRLEKVLSGFPDFNEENAIKLKEVIDQYPTVKSMVDVLKRYKPKK